MVAKVEQTKSVEPLIVIVGPTASGKTFAALELAKAINGEIICADSRTVYKGMDIGTAKPTAKERQQVPHHILDVVAPDESFTVGDFQRLTNEAIADITARGKVPIMVGGTGLYVDAVLFGFDLRAKPDPALREMLNAMTVEGLQEEIKSRGLQLPPNPQNPRHLSRVIETNGQLPSRQPLRANTLILGINPSRDVIRGRVTKRIDMMLEDGFVDEVQRLYEQYGDDAEALRAPGYRAFREFITDQINLKQAKALFIKNDMALAKRQVTWFKRNNSIQWLVDRSEIVAIATTFLNKKS